MIPEYLMFQIGAHRQIEDRLFGPNSPTTWPPVNGKEFANTEPSHISTPGAVAKCDGASEGPERDGHKPLMRNRTGLETPTPTGSTAPGNHFCTCAGFRIASDCPRHAQ